MTFGFPAYHEAHERTARPVPELHARLMERLRELGWLVVLDRGNEIHATSGMGLWSWGEKITIRFAPGTVTVRSQCALVTQCIDWGKNRRNVESLMGALPPAVEERVPAAGGESAPVAMPSSR